MLYVIKGRNHSTSTVPLKAAVSRVTVTNPSSKTARQLMKHMSK